jgi:acyl carrier protein
VSTKAAGSDSVEDTRPGNATDAEYKIEITRIWEEVLRIDGVVPDDDFFELGGHSLAASQVISRIKRDLAVEVTLVEFFERPTVAGLAEFVRSAAGLERS